MGIIKVKEFRFSVSDKALLSYNTFQFSCNYCQKIYFPAYIKKYDTSN